MSEGSLWSRDGHLHELALMRAAAGELAPAERAAFEAHLEACAPCRAHHEALAEELARPLPPLSLPEPEAEIIPFPQRIRSAAPALATLLSLAAVLAVYLRPPPPSDDNFALRGGALTLEVYRGGAPYAQRLRSGDSVAAGDRLAFRVASPDGGQLLVFGIDSSGERYPVWPADPALHSSAFAATASPRELEVGLELDDAPGAERIVAARCEAPFTADGLLGALGAEAPLPAAPQGCSLAEIRLPKAAERR